MLRFPPRPLRRQRAVHALHLIAITAVLAAGSLATAVPVRAANDFKPLGALPALGTGRVWSVAINQATPAVILVGSDAGVYTSRDAGATWKQTLAGVRVWVVGFDARNPGTTFAGTATEGVWSSGDGGTTWAASATGLNNMDVRALAFGLDGLAAGTDDGVYLSRDGKTWSLAGLQGNSVSSLAVATNSPQFTVIAGIDSGHLAPGFLYRGTGATWQPLQSGLPAGAAATALSAGPTSASVPQRPFLAVTTKGVYRSGDSGTTWTAATGVPPAVTATTATFDPLDPAVVYAGADQGGSTGGSLLRSTDGGMSFGAFGAGLPASAVNVERIALAPSNPLGVVVALVPPKGGGALYAAQDTTLPAPPALTAEAPGAPVPTVVSPAPTARPTPTPAPAQAGTTQPGGLGSFLGAAFHWPTPLVFEIIFVLVLIYAAIRWRERSFIEGPP